MKQQLTIDFLYEPEAQLSSFYASGNEVLIASLQQLIQQQANSHAQNLAFVHGPMGCGKSHLLQALCQYADELNVSAQYIPCKVVKQMPTEFTYGLEANELLLIDDVDEFALDGNWQRALFDLINRCLELEHKVIFAARLPADAVGFNLPDLVSRLNWGQKWAIQPLNEQQRQYMLQQRSEHRGIAMPDELASYIVLRCQQDNASIIQCLDVLDQQSLAEKRKLTIPFVKSVMGW
ncbi:DNA replication initiation factor [Catenovulum agarivorans DS-2]|uniref:DNA replication initiation factor n=1 Tax=Catenovulum agarivorans DS-2 TaxID=1328313 RepID=W7QAW6_9ALTE|nr:DnaA regulatory inactivator Hda [Catenovulum agarivorans]EWH09984.1 DNA replication initiation factor [Catenovulum agarivorans DS-2]